MKREPPQPGLASYGFRFVIEVFPEPKGMSKAHFLKGKKVMIKDKSHLGVFCSVLMVLGLVVSSVTGADLLDSLKPDKVLLNGKIVTVDEDFGIAEAIAIKDGKFVAVGTNAEIRELIGPNTEEIDLEGRTVLPGFIDPHVHFAHKVGKRSDRYEDMFAEARSIEQIRRALQLKVEQTPPGEIIWFSRGVRRASELAEKRWPTRYDLDPVSPDHPVIMGFAADHVTIVNSKLIDMVGTITKDTPQPTERGFAGEIMKDPETGEPTGILYFNQIVCLKKEFIGMNIVLT